MAEPVSILGVVSASIALLNLARQGLNSISEDVRKFQTYGKTLSRFLHDVEVIRQLLVSWEQEWEIGNVVQGGEGVRYFGDVGWQKIREELALIADTSLSLVGLLAPLMLLDQQYQSPGSTSSTAGTSPATSRPGKLIKRRAPPPEVQRGREFMGSLSYQTLQAWEEHQQHAKFISKKYGFGKKLKDILGSKEKHISEKIQELRMRYLQLKHLSERSFEAIYTLLSASMPIEQRQEAVQKERDSHYALCFRKYAIGMIQAFQPSAREPEDIGLELNTRCDPRTKSDIVNYTLITEPSRSHGSYALSIRAVGPHLPENIQPFQVFEDAYHRAQSGHPVWLGVHSSTTSDLYFSITASPLAVAGHTIRLGEGLRIHSTQQFLSYREAIELAYRLADSCLLLLNTPWMSAFSSENLIIRLQTQEPARYTIGFRQIDRDRCELLRQLQDSIQPQAYSIGILLIELGLKKKVTDFQEQPLALRMSDGEELELEETILRTRDALGPSFAQVVWCCFYETRLPLECFDVEQKDELELVMLHEFYQNIFLPLKRMRDKIHRRHSAQHN